MTGLQMSLQTKKLNGSAIIVIKRLQQSLVVVFTKELVSKSDKRSKMAFVIVAEDQGTMHLTAMRLDMQKGII